MVIAWCLLILSQPEIFAEQYSREGECCGGSHYGTANFSVTDPSLWYTIDTNSYPDAVPLSLERNKGFRKGGVYLSPTGFTVGEAGNYWVSITAILQNTVEDSTPLIPVFLVRDETFDPADPSTLGGVVSLPTNSIETVNASGILENVEEGTLLSLVATNAGNPFPQPIKVVAWGISIYKMP